MDDFFKALGMNWGLRQLIKRSGYGVGETTQMKWDEREQDWMSTNSDGEWNKATCTRDLGPGAIKVDSGWGETTMYTEWCPDGVLCTTEMDGYETSQMRRTLEGDKMYVVSSVDHRRRGGSGKQTYEKVR
jgi:hypothetical protein